MCRVLRFFCLTYGYSLSFHKINNEKLTSINSSLIKTSVSEKFTEFKTNTIKDDLQPIHIEYGNDSLEEIGDPKIKSNKDSNLFSLWEETFTATFSKEINKQEKKKTIFNENELLEKYVERLLDHELISFE